MYTFDVLVWEDQLEDGSTGYGAWCSYVLGVWGQGDTEEEEALADIVSVMTDVIRERTRGRMGRSLADPETAASEMAEIVNHASFPPKAFRTRCTKYRSRPRCQPASDAALRKRVGRARELRRLLCQDGIYRSCSQRNHWRYRHIIGLWPTHTEGLFWKPRDQDRHVMGKIITKQLRMTVDEFREAMNGNIPERFTNPRFWNSGAR